jgi:mannosyltransferase
MFNESASYAYAHLRLHELPAALGTSDAFFGLYYALMHLWLGFGTSEAAMRSFSVVSVVGAVVAIGYFTRALGGAAAGIFAALWAAFDPFLFDLAQQARPYALLLLFGVLTSAAFVAAAQRPTRGRWAIYVLVSALGCYVHLYLFSVVAAHALWASAFRRALWKRGLAVAVAAIGCALVPLLAVMRGYPEIDSYIELPIPHRLVDTLYWFAGSRPLALFAVLVAVGALVIGRRLTARERELGAFLALWLLVPLLGTFVASYLVRPLYAERYLAEAWPAYVVAIGLLLARLRPAIGAIALGAFAALAVTTTLNLHVAQAQDWRAASDLVVGSAISGDALVVYPKRGTVPYTYYRERLRTSGPPQLYPAREWFPLVQGQDTVEAPAVDTPPRWARRIWVLEGWTDIPGTDGALRAFLAPLASDYRLAFRRTFTRVGVLRFDRVSATEGRRTDRARDRDRTRPASRPDGSARSRAARRRT